MLQRQFAGGPLRHRRVRAAYGCGLLFAGLGLCLAAARYAQAQDSTPGAPPASSIWKAGVGEGFNKGAEEFGFSAGGGLGAAIFGGARRHDWYLGTLQYGIMISGVEAPDHWYRGNWELVGQAFGGRQFDPESAYLFGITALLRYNFAVGHRFVPFIEAGAGLTDTDIRDRDLSTYFEFNLQSGLGVRYFLRDDLALMLQGRLIHLSNASISSPNLGVNNFTVMFGVSWFF